MPELNIYVASSWRNPLVPDVIAALRADGHTVYDFTDHGFTWDKVSPGWEKFSAAEFRAALLHPAAEASFARDMDALRACDACVLVHPSGRSAHLEAGWAAGAGKPLYILTREGERPDLMTKMAALLTADLDGLRAALRSATWRWSMSKRALIVGTVISVVAYGAAGWLGLVGHEIVAAIIALPLSTVLAMIVGNRFLACKTGALHERELRQYECDLLREAFDRK